MRWRGLGVALVLLAVGLAGGYAVADRTAEEPTAGTGAEPIPAVSPAVPIPPEVDTLPDPTAAPLQPDLPNHEEELRIAKRGAGAGVLVPDGWLENRLTSSQTWSFAPAINIRNTYSLRVDLMIGQRYAVSVAKTTRLTALQSAEDDGNIEALTITAETANGFEATYIDKGYRRVTMERWVGDENGTAYAEVAVTGRTVDTEGLRDLVVRVAESVRYLEPLPPKDKDEERDEQAG